MKYEKIDKQAFWGRVCGGLLGGAIYFFLFNSNVLAQQTGNETQEIDVEILEFDMEDDMEEDEPPSTPSSSPESQNETYSSSEISESMVTEEAMGDITVSDERIDTTIADSAIRTEIINKEQIQQSGAKTVGDALEDMLGVQVGTQFYENRGAPKGVQIQGCDPRRLLITVNGRRVIGTADGIVDTSQLPLDNIERIEVIKGSSSALYGSDAICGVISIVTKEAPKNGYNSTIQGEYGRFNAYQGKIEISGRPHEQVGFQTGFDIRGRDSFDMDASTVDTDGDRIRSYHGFFGLSYHPISDLGIKLDGEYLHETREGILSSYQDVLDTTYVYDTPLTLHRPSGALTLRYNFSPSDWVRIKIYDNFFRSDSAEDLKNSPRYRTRITDNNYANLTLDGQMLAGSWNLFSGGFEFSHEWMNVVKKQTDAFDGETFENRETPEVDGETVYQLAAFFQDEMTPAEWVTLIPGLRYT